MLIGRENEAGPTTASIGMDMDPSELQGAYVIGTSTF